jgi:hypothetical protein
MVNPWLTLEEEYIAFLLPAPKFNNYIKQVLMLGLRESDPETGFSTCPQSGL